MRKSRVLTCSLGLLAAALFFAALTLAPAATSAGTVCSCPSSYIWQTATGHATGTGGCPSAACRIDAENHTSCGIDGVCAYGDFIVGCYLAGGVYHATCDLKYVCNICIDYPD
jgi:hypothetical protein